jgi:addiction module HigA family antidote
MTRIPTHRAPTHPGEMLFEEFIKPLGTTQTELAEWIGVSYPRLNEIIHGKRGITPDTALRLEQVFGMDAQFWLNLQLAWDLFEAKQSPAAKEIGRIKRHPGVLAAAGARG